MRVQNQYADVYFSVSLTPAHVASIRIQHIYLVYSIFLRFYLSFSADANKITTFHIGSVRNNRNSKLVAGFN